MVLITMFVSFLIFLLFLSHVLSLPVCWCYVGQKSWEKLATKKWHVFLLQMFSHIFRYYPLS